jgi:hypothetical protein
MSKRVPAKKAQRADGTAHGSNKTSTSEVQLRRDRQQTGVAQSLAEEAERLFPALRAGVLTPERLVEQAKYVLSKAKLETERHREGEISEAHAGHIITSMRKFAKALDQVGVKVAGLRRVKQSHYVDVMRVWEKQPPGEARRVGWILSLLRRLFVAIGRPDVIPRGDRNMELLSRNRIGWGSDTSFLISSHFDWASSGIDVEIIFQAVSDPGMRVSAKMMHLLGMSLLEAATWQAVDPERCCGLRLDGANERRRSRDVEFSSDRAYAAKQMAAVEEAWNYCKQHDRPTICPPELDPKDYAELLRRSIRKALAQFPGRRLTPMKLRDGFFCQVFRDHAGVTLQEARSRHRVAEDDRRFARAWNEAKCQLGVQGAKAPHANKGRPLSQAQSESIARSLRPISVEFRALGIGKAWVGDVDASTGKCLFVQLLEGAQASALLRLHQLIEEAVVVKLRVVRVLRAGDVPEGAAPVMARSAPV